jgi:hypothetical protein
LLPACLPTCLPAFSPLQGLGFELPQPAFHFLRTSCCLRACCSCCRCSLLETCLLGEGIRLGLQADVCSPLPDTLLLPAAAAAAVLIQSKQASTWFLQAVGCSPLPDTLLLPAAAAATCCLLLLLLYSYRANMHQPGSCRQPPAVHLLTLCCCLLLLLLLRCT